MRIALSDWVKKEFERADLRTLQKYMKFDTINSAKDFFASQLLLNFYSVDVVPHRLTCIDR